MASMDFYKVAMVARDSEGRCSWWSVAKLIGRPKAVEGEARAALYAMSTAVAKGWSSVIMEGVSLQIINALRGRGFPDASYGALLDDCFFLLNSFSDCSFSFIKRQGNCVAHALAQMAVLDQLDGDVLPFDVVIYA
ncbi:PREDICTED: uncharacterized protein LOC105969414 [Erythranthe guttata]|uniref:uncharacterized protein LOC105969414 n=1 Tax=Erythranthe guttata TaxID=4155 RepID=UPI00064D9BE3|nr:PREDICTED: uncharacterized protein LOC105969414 [Erythranthe guttata]|eukprot:XP_012849622.1 PREDICTED: uncharacterized protein LOC105969414 [Erythranthe guttata]